MKSLLLLALGFASVASTYARTPSHVKDMTEIEEMSAKAAETGKSLVFIFT
ncbi:MAG: hypothetical protein ACPG32_10225 [Akkermansiaceae bacterium]